MNFESDGTLDYNKTVKALWSHEYPRHQQKLELDLKSHETPPTRPSIEKPLVWELKAVLNHLRYVFLGANNTLLVIIAANPNDEHVED